MGHTCGLEVAQHDWKVQNPFDYFLHDVLTILLSQFWGNCLCWEQLALNNGSEFFMFLCVVAAFLHAHISI